MNLNHFEAIALVQKIAFSLPDKYFDKVDVAVLPPFTDLRSVQTLVDGDKLRLTYGAQDLSQHDSGAYTGDIGGPLLAKLGCTFVVVRHSQRRTVHHPDVAAGVRVLYGGWVKAKNVGEVVAEEDVDGALVGGASLDGEQFATLSAIAAGGPLP